MRRAAAIDVFYLGSSQPSTMFVGLADDGRRLELTTPGAIIRIEETQAMDLWNEMARLYRWTKP